MVRDPVEHALWSRYYPSIADWFARPYFKDAAIALNIAAAEQLYPAASAEKQAIQDQNWRRAEARFIAVTEYRSVGAVSNRLVEHGYADGAERVRELSARVALIIEAAKRREEQMRVELKQLLKEGGLSTLLSDERYVPSKYGEPSGKVPVAFTISQTSLIGTARLGVKDIHAPLDGWDGVRLLIDMPPPRVTDAVWGRYDERLYEGRPTQRLFDWFQHMPERWSEFQYYHHKQLHADHRGVLKLLKVLSPGNATLLHMGRGEYSVAQSLCTYLLKYYSHVFGAS
jgi:uncharacterized protein YeaO (DUF488 family)